MMRTGRTDHSPSRLAHLDDPPPGECVATPSEKGKQVQITVNLWYDQSTKRVHLTSNDPDLPREGIHTNLKPGTQADRSARALLRKFGKPDGTEA